MGFDASKLAKMFSDAFTTAVSSITGGEDKNKQVTTKKNSVFIVDNSDKGSDWFVKTPVPTERDAYNGFTVDGSAIPDAAKNALYEIGGEGSNLSNVWVQPGADNKVTYGITDSEGNRLWVRYELDEDGNAVETKRTTIDKNGNKESTGVESKTDIPNSVLNDLANSIGVNLNPSSVAVQEMNNGKSFVYSAKDEAGRTTYIKYNLDENGNYTQVRKTQELGNGVFQSIENNIVSTYTLDDNGEMLISKTATLDDNGEVLSVEFADGKTLDNDLVKKIKNILGSSYDYTTLNITNESKYGDITYNVKDKDGNDAWVRFDKDGNETARTVETKENQFYSIYDESDVNEGKENSVRVVMRQFLEDGQVVVDEANESSDKYSYEDLGALHTMLSQVSSVLNGDYNANQVSSEVLDVANAIKEKIADGTIKTTEDIERIAIQFLSNAFQIDPEDVIGADTLGKPTSNGLNTGVDWFITKDAPENKDEYGGYKVSSSNVPDEIKEQIKKDFDVDVDEIWVQKNSENLVTYGFKDQNNKNIWVRYEIKDDGTLNEVKRTV